MALIVWIHNLVYRLVFGLVRLTVSLVWRWTLVVVALLGEEVRRYAGLTLSGTVIVLLGKLFLAVSAPRWLVLVDLGVLAIWAMALRRAFRYTRHNNLMRVRNRQSVRDLHENVKDIRGRVNDGLAKRAKGTPLEGAWSSNRSAREEERAAAERAATQAEEERAAAEEQARRDRISEAERERHLEKLGAEHNPFE